MKCKWARPRPGGERNGSNCPEMRVLEVGEALLYIYHLSLEVFDDVLSLFEGEGGIVVMEI